MKEEDIAKLVIRDARIFNSREDRVKSAISLLRKLCGEGQALSELIDYTSFTLSFKGKGFGVV
jgi:hypothetical protein